MAYIKLENNKQGIGLSSHENLRLYAQHSHKKPGMRAQTCGSGCGEMLAPLEVAG